MDKWTELHLETVYPTLSFPPAKTKAQVGFGRTGPICAPLLIVGSLIEVSLLCQDHSEGAYSISQLALGLLGPCTALAHGRLQGIY